MIVCLKCGDEGIIEALVYCCKCKLNPQHFYCLEKLPETIDVNVEWFCHECKPENHFGQLCSDLIARDKPTLSPLNTSLSVTEERMQAGHVKSVLKGAIELEVEVEVASTDTQIESDCEESSRSEKILGDMDDEYDDKAEKDKMGKQREDIAWMHAVRIKKPKCGLVCNYCSRAMIGRGSITRLKEHLAGGYDFKTIKACPKVPPEVQESMKKVVKEKEKLKAALAAKARGNGLEIVDFAGRIKVRKDPAWKYAYPIDGKVNSMVCKLCSRTISGGGITRFKHHLAEKCIDAPLEVQVEMTNMLTKKDIDRAHFDANVDKIKREIQERREQGKSSTRTSSADLLRMETDLQDCNP